MQVKFKSKNKNKNNVKFMAQDPPRYQGSSQLKRMNLAGISNTLINAREFQK
jgi:hypothetical protein